MRVKQVSDIVRPFQDALPMNPSVELSDKVIHAVELMASHNCNRIAVVRNRRLIGMVRLDDALEKLGLKKKNVQTGP